LRRSWSLSTVTNTNFDEDAIVVQILKTLALRDELNARLACKPIHDAARWGGGSKEDFLLKALSVGLDSLSENEDLRSLKSLVLFGIKGLAA
jgi:hydroxylamine reductase